MQATDDPVLKRFRAELEKAYGDTLDRVVLFGSRARGDARPDSDYDVAVFLKGSRGFGHEGAIIADIEADILIHMGAVINTLPFEVSARDDQTGFMENVRREGREL